MAGVMCTHDVRVRARPGVLAFFDQIGKGFIDKRLELLSLLLRKRADSDKAIRTESITFAFPLNKGFEHEHDFFPTEN
jgi:hypothetical protein